MEPQLLVPQPQIRLPGRGGLEVSAAEYGLVEDVRLQKKPGLTGTLVLAVVKLTDARGDLTDLPPSEAGGYKIPAMFLLEFPETGVGLKNLAVIYRVKRVAAVRREVADACELPVGALYERPEGLEGGSSAAFFAFDVVAHGRKVKSELGRWSFR